MSAPTKRKAPSELADLTPDFATNYTSVHSLKKQRTEADPVTPSAPSTRPTGPAKKEFDLESFLQSDPSTPHKPSHKPFKSSSKFTKSASSTPAAPAPVETPLTKKQQQKAKAKFFRDQAFNKLDKPTGVVVKQSLGQRKALEKIQERNNKVSRFEAEKRMIDADDYLVRDRDEENEINRANAERSARKAEKSEQHTKFINATLQFMLDTFSRVKQSRQLIKKGEDPLHEYDHFIMYPLDIQSIADKFSPSEEVLEGFEWLHNTRKMVWDLPKKTKDQEVKPKDPLQRLLAKKAKGKKEDSGFLKLRPVTNNDLAYMVKQRAKVTSLERVLEKENEFTHIKTKMTDRQIKNKKMLARTTDGQPVMKHRVKNLLSKINKTNGL